MHYLDLGYMAQIMLGIAGYASIYLLAITVGVVQTLRYLLRKGYIRPKTLAKRR